MLRAGAPLPSMTRALTITVPETPGAIGASVACRVHAANTSNMPDKISVCGLVIICFPKVLLNLCHETPSFSYSERIGSPVTSFVGRMLNFAEFVPRAVQPLPGGVVVKVLP
jgi:hypothetical protein